jgi:hypothetical protein
MLEGFKYAGIARPVIARCPVIERDTTTMERVRAGSVSHAHLNHNRGWEGGLTPLFLRRLTRRTRPMAVLETSDAVSIESSPFLNRTNNCASSITN